MEVTNKRMNIRTDKQKDENYIPLDINAGGINIIKVKNYDSFYRKMVLQNVSHGFT